MARFGFVLPLSSSVPSSRRSLLVLSRGAWALSLNCRQSLLRFVFASSLCFLVQFSLAQSIIGLAPFAPLQGGGAEIVNLANLNVHLSIPVVQKPGRGLDFHYVLNYDSTVWTHAYPYGAWTPAPNWGWRGVSEASV